MEKDFIEKKLEKKAIEAWKSKEESGKIQLKVVLFGLGLTTEQIETESEEIYTLIFNKLEQYSVYPNFIKNKINLQWDEINSNLKKLEYLFDGVINKKEVKEEENKEVKENKPE